MDILRYFFETEVTRCAPYGNGHINETYICETADGCSVLQGINKQVFPEPQKIIENILTLQKLCPDNNSILPILPTRSGAFAQDTEFYLWRLTPFAEGYTTHQKIESPSVGKAVGRAYGQFLLDFSTLDPEQLHYVLEDFHNGTKRFLQLQEAYKLASEERKNKGTLLFENIKSQTTIFSHFSKLGLPLRVTHNDTKVNNVLISDTDAKVIDLDTVMPGSMLYDFGDMCRSAANTGAENEKDASLIAFDTAIFEALVAGYAVTKDVLEQVEKENLVNSIAYMALMLACRFLADYFAGDKYFKTSFPEENYIRARNQYLLYRDIVAKKSELERIVKRYFS